MTIPTGHVHYELYLVAEANDDWGTGEQIYWGHMSEYILGNLRPDDFPLQYMVTPQSPPAGWCVLVTSPDQQTWTPCRRWRAPAGLRDAPIMQDDQIETEIDEVIKAAST